MTVQELHAALSAAIAEGRGSMPVGWMRGGEDDRVYAIECAYPTDYVDNEGQIDGYLHLGTEGYVAIGIEPEPVEDEDDHGLLY